MSVLSRTMRIGLDCRTTSGVTGISQYGRHLREALLLAGRGDDYIIFDKAEKAIPFWTSHISDRRRFSSARLDLLHVLGGAAPYGYRHPYAMTVHDLAIYRHPEWFPEGQRFSTHVSYPSSMKLARRLIVPTEATKAELIDLFKVREEKISVISHGVSVPSSRVDSETDDEAIPRLPRSPELARNDAPRYILSLGTIEPRKNIPSLTRAYRLMVDRMPELKDVELRLAGAVGWRAEEIVDEIRKTQCEGYRITMEGEVNEDRKWELLRNASCFAFPSFYEGFGMPLLEAFASGTPVVSSDHAALKEVSGGAALVIAPEDVEAWTDSLARVLTDAKTAEGLRSKGAERAKAFSWEKTADLTREVYRSVISSR